MISNIHDLDISGHEVHCLHLSQDKNYPLDAKLLLTTNTVTFQNVEKCNVEEILTIINNYNPEICIIGGWNIKKYKKAVKNLKTLRVLAMDNPWQNRPRQWLGIIFRKQLIKPYFDVAFVPGSKQEKFAQKLGFKKSAIYRNLFSIDKVIYANLPQLQELSSRSFLYVGRLIPEKGFDILLKAYKMYSDSVENPWGLNIVGTGPLMNASQSETTVKYLGFLGHSDLVKLYRNSNCLLLPSRREPWGIVMQEAASQGLPMIATKIVGAVGDLLVDQYNGTVISKCSIKKLQKSLTDMHKLTVEQRTKFRLASLALSKKYETHTFAERVEEMAKRNLASNG